SVIADMPILAIKIGLIGSIENGRVIRDFIKSHPEIPVILDPIINSSTGQNLTDEPLVHFIQQELLPRTTILTPNSLEARQLAPRGSINLTLCAEEILSLGVKHLLITGGHDDTVQIINHYFSALGEETRFRWPRLPGEFRGSGCTLAASIAALVAQGHSVLQALSDAQRYTWHSLKHARAIGQGQLIPDRYQGSATLKMQHDPA
ncbi:MAG TPA: hydroxymethylpyrimidine/phosphomethylpyrimidine kinase, partial [Gammaproteobacteria bacterium]|nr:hydroxymethylpyrimidine/phosphomethylpyrimidine kinase [Gammaproteobacteria bacterium]